MNKYKIFSMIAVFSCSSMAFASGSHSESESHSNTQEMDHSMMKNMSHWMAPKAESATKNPIKLSEKSVIAGQKLYAANCVSCHGVTGEGDGPTGAYLKPKPANLKAMANQHPDGDFAYKIKVGRGAMPGWDSSMSDTQVWHLVNFIKYLGRDTRDTAKKETKGHSHADGEGHES
ncbi:MAG: mono/diheme cytochrome c family protein [Gammaproteobacteria bacterium]|jgi:mono/diheme cytochrome c family protein